MTQAESPALRRSRLGLLLIVGILLIGATIAVAGWMGGYFKPKGKVALVTWNEDPYWDLVIQGAQDAATRWNLDLTVVRSKPDEKEQTQHVRDLLAGGYNSIAISPNNPTAQSAVLSEAAENSVLITFDSDAPISKRYGFVGTDNYQAGQVCADEVRSALPDGGEIIVSVGSIAMNNGRDRRQGLIDNLLDRRRSTEPAVDAPEGELKGGKYSIVATVLDEGDPAKATALVADAIKAHPNVKCIAGLFSYSAPAIVKAIDQAGKKGQIKVIGFDESDDTQAGVENGAIYSSVLQDQYRCGYETLYLMYDALRGDPQERSSGVRVIHLRTWVLKADNLEELRADKMVHQPKVKPAT